MIKNKTVAVVVPAYNEEQQIAHVIETMPEFVDRIIVVNDCSKDDTGRIVGKYINISSSSRLKKIKKPEKKLSPTKYNHADIVLQNIEDKENRLFTPSHIANTDPSSDRVILINHVINRGVGSAISSGYRWCRDHNIDCTAVMAGDGQMDPGELESICMPVIEDDVDYVKGNRLIHRSAWLVVPRVRYFGNSILSILTKIASGYWHVSDTQTGYTAISLKALKAIRLHKIYRKFGMPNDMLVKLNIAFCTIKEVEIKPVYRVGEKSKMKILGTIPRIAWLLSKSFFKRLWIKYFFRDFHPIFLFYNFAIFLNIINIPFIIKIIEKSIKHQIIANATLFAFVFLFISGFQSLFFAMWMDIQDNEKLDKTYT